MPLFRAILLCHRTRVGVEGGEAAVAASRLSFVNNVSNSDGVRKSHLAEIAVALDRIALATSHHLARGRTRLLRVSARATIAGYFLRTSPNDKIKRFADAALAHSAALVLAAQQFPDRGSIDDFQ
jgi:hypothetical protein